MEILAGIYNITYNLADLPCTVRIRQVLNLVDLESKTEDITIWLPNLSLLAVALGT